MGNSVDFNIMVVRASVSAGTYNHLEVELEGVNLNELVEVVGPSDILGQFNEEEIVSNFGADALLDEIGEEKVRKYFGIGEEK